MSHLRILIAGASGFIGTELVRQLKGDGHTVVKLGRGAPRAADEFSWAPSSNSIDLRAFDGVDAVVNLAGASTGRIPWTTGYKREILYSRVDGTRTLASAMGKVSAPPSIFLNGSAVGYYGDQPGVTLSETAARGSGFLPDVVTAWEKAVYPAPESTRVVSFRTGLVVGRGGAFTPLVPLTRLGLAARIGSGQQHWPWISLHDEAAAIRHLLTSTISGVVNLAGPTPARSGQVTDALARVLHRWHVLAVPEFALRALGDAGRELLLASQHVVPQKLIDDGFVFRDETVDQALRALAS